MFLAQQSTSLFFAAICFVFHCALGLRLLRLFYSYYYFLLIILFLLLFLYIFL